MNKHAELIVWCLIIVLVFIYEGYFIASDIISNMSWRVLLTVLESSCVIPALVILILVFGSMFYMELRRKL